MNPILKIAFFLLIIIGMNACKKSTTTRSVEYRNETGRTLYFYWYRSKADLGNTNASLLQKTIPPHSTITLTGADLDNLPDYWWIDWFSDDYNYGNWGKWGFEQNSPYSDVAVYNEDDRNIGRKIVINGNDSAGRWVAVAMADGSPTPAPIPAGEHYEVTITRNGYYTLNENGTIRKDSIMVTDEETPRGRGLQVSLSSYYGPTDPHNLAAHMDQGHFNWTGASYPAYGGDTLYLIRDSGLIQLYMVKQP